MTTARPRPVEVPERIARDVGAEIRRCRLAAGMSQGELAQRVGTHRPIVSRIERGLHTPSLEVVELYARALGVHPVWDVLHVLDDIVQEWPS